MDDIRNAVAIEHVIGGDAGVLSGAQIVNHAQLPTFQRPSQNSGAVSEQEFIRSDRQFDSAVGAQSVLAVAANLLSYNEPELRGIFPMTAHGDASWAEFAEWNFAASARNGGPTAQVKHITSANYPTAAKRPANSRLDCTKLQRKHGVSLPNWRGSAETVVHRLLENS